MAPISEVLICSIISVKIADQLFMTPPVSAVTRWYVPDEMKCKAGLIGMPAIILRESRVLRLIPTEK
jgi:hypothetical protein